MPQRRSSMSDIEQSATVLLGSARRQIVKRDALIDLPERAPDALRADEGYDADAIRTDLGKRKIEAVIPGRSNCRVKIEHNRVLYKQRNRIERMFGHLKTNRAIATRYDQLANSFLGMIHIATTRYRLKFVHAV